MVDKVIVSDEYIIKSIFNRVEHDNTEFEEGIKNLARSFLLKYPAFTIENINVFDCYCDLKCIVNLKLK